MVGLVSDFFLQMFFFTTVLSIDIRRMEVRHKQLLLPCPHYCKNVTLCWALESILFKPIIIKTILINAVFLMGSFI